MDNNAKEIVENRLAYSLTDDDIRYFLPGVPITMYSRFAEEPGIHEVVDSAGRGIVLFVSSKTEEKVAGHWLAVHVRPTAGTVLLYDPYGGTRDPWGLNHGFVRKPYSLSQLGESTPLLVPYFKRHGLTAVFNVTRDQTMASTIGTCGRHCVVRLWKLSTPDEEYDEWIHGFKESPDRVVTRLTDGADRR
jgi:hypothetical protein